MELGGKSPLIVFDDADLESAIGGAMLGNFYSTGQVCSNGTRVFVHKNIRERFIERLVERTRKSVSAIPSMKPRRWVRSSAPPSATRFYPISKKGKAEGATLACGGGVPKLQGFDKGFFIEPTVFADVTDTMTIAREEIFGPVMSVLEFSDEDEVIARAQ
ncbi:betaine aldehyde dehydrogenase [Brucella melitensis]|nr:betaine aldehyde dehydrogenase [Brucella melitensis]